MDAYYLVARDKDNNKFCIIDINEKWYLGCDGYDASDCSCSLEAIDLITSKFANREQLARKLFQDGCIDDENVDIFIASKRKKDGKEFVRFDEVIYNPTNSKRMVGFKKVAAASLAGDMFNDTWADLNLIYDDIIFAVYSCNDLYMMIMDGDTSIPKGFVGLLKGIPAYSDIPEDLKFDTSFRRNDYYTVRSVVETLNRFEFISKGCREDRFLAHDAFIEENAADRMALVPRLAFQLEQDFIAEQLSLTDYFDGRDQDVVRKAARRIVQQNSDVAQISDGDVAEPITAVEVNQNISLEQKKQAVFRVLRKLPKDVFSRTSNGYKVNYDLFKYPLLEKEKAGLDTLLTGNMPKFIADYVLHYHRLQDACAYGGRSHEIDELKRDTEWDLSLINNRFKSSKCVYNTYTWCMLWEGCKKRDEAYQSGGAANTGVGTDAKIFRKKQ